MIHLSQIEVTRNLKFHLVQPATQEESRERIANGKNLEADDVGGELTLLDVHDSAKSDAYIPSEVGSGPKAHPRSHCVLFQVKSVNADARS